MLFRSFSCGNKPYHLLFFLYIQHPETAVPLKEICKLHNHTIVNNIIKKFLKKILRPSRNTNIEPQYNLLPSLIKEFSNSEVLIVLDSAGGVGHMEFQITDELMKNKSYYILLDDTHHLKHFRGYEIIKNRGDFTIINTSEKNGWVLAYHKN